MEGSSFSMLANQPERLVAAEFPARPVLRHACC
jgi:hypothetical protein